MALITETGDQNCPVFMIAESPPQKAEKLSLVPLDYRHTTTTCIWTPIEYRLYKYAVTQGKPPFDFDNIYKRNAVLNSKLIPQKGVEWGDEVNSHINEFAKIVEKNRPKLIITFGAFAYEFVKRIETTKKYAKSHWSCDKIGNAFRKSIDNYDSEKINIVPLLHNAFSKDIKNGSLFTCENEAFYYDYVSEKLAPIFISLSPIT